MIADADAARRADRGARLRLRQCRGRGAAGLDRRAHHGRSRRCRDRVPPAPRPQDAGRHQIREPDARLLLRARHHRLPHRRKLGRDRRRAGGRHRRADRRHHHHRRDARRQRAQGASTTASSCARRPIWSPRAAPTGARPSARLARVILDRIAAQARARAFREVRTRFPGCDDALLAEAKAALRRRRRRSAGRPRPAC